MIVSLQIGVPSRLHSDAAALYWQAFGDKLGRVMGPDAKALQFLCRVIRPDHAIVALSQQGDLLGLAGFKTPQGSFAGGEPADLRAVYGRIGSAWRIPLLAQLSRDIDNARFLLDGLCVAQEARGQGIGTALLHEVEAEAVRRGYAQVRLDVVDTNVRAQALYQRLGFHVDHAQNIGALRHVFGFRSATVMVKSV